MLQIKSIENVGPTGNEVNFFRAALNDHYKLWAEAAQAAFHRDLAVLTARKGALNFEPFLRAVPVKDMVEIIVQEATKIAQGSETYSPESGILYITLGRKVHERYRVLRKEKTGVLTKVKGLFDAFSWKLRLSEIVQKSVLIFSN